MSRIVMNDPSVLPKSHPKYQEAMTSWQNESCGYSHGYFDRLLGLDQRVEYHPEDLKEEYAEGWLDANGDIVIYLKDDDTNS